MSPAIRIAMAFALCGGCTSIRSDVRIVDYPEGMRHVDRVVKGSRVYRAAAEIDDDNLIVKLTRVETCEEADVPLLRRKRVTSKTEVPSLLGIRAEWAAGVGGLGLGGLTLLNPDRTCSQTAQDGTSSTTDPQACIALGWSLVGLGTVLTTIAIVDSIRLTDEEQDLGIREGEYVASTRACHAGPVIDTAVELQLGGTAASRRGQTSRLGEVAFSMFDVDGGALPSPGHPASIAIGGEVVPVEVTDQQHQALVRNLRDNPTFEARRARPRVGAQRLRHTGRWCGTAPGETGQRRRRDRRGTRCMAAREARVRSAVVARSPAAAGHGPEGDHRQPDRSGPARAEKRRAGPARRHARRRPGRSRAVSRRSGSSPAATQDGGRTRAGAGVQRTRPCRRGAPAVPGSLHLRAAPRTADMGSAEGRGGQEHQRTRWRPAVQHRPDHGCGAL